MFSKEDLANLDISDVVVVDGENEPEVGSEIGEIVLLSENGQMLSIFEEHVEPVLDDLVVGLVLGAEDGLENLQVCGGDESSENAEKGNEKLLLFMEKPGANAAVAQIVESDGPLVEVFSDRAHLDGEPGEVGLAVHVAVPDEADGVVPLLNDQESDHLLQTVQHEVASVLVAVLLLPHHLPSLQII